MTHYEILGVQPDASVDEIKAAFRRAAKQAHPDREGGSTERMQAVNKAYEVLSDPERRQRYDATGTDERSTIEAQAFDLLMQTFERALQGSGDVVRLAKQGLKTLHQNIVHSKMGIEQQRASLKARSGKTTVKTGENLVQALIDRKLAGLTHQHAQAVEALKVHALAEKMLDNYEGEPEPPAMPGYSDQQQNMLSALMQMQATRGFTGGWR